MGAYVGILEEGLATLGQRQVSPRRQVVREHKDETTKDLEPAGSKASVWVSYRQQVSLHLC